MEHLTGLHQTLLLLGVCTRARAETETRPDLRTKIKYLARRG